MRRGRRRRGGSALGTLFTLAGLAAAAALAWMLWVPGLALTALAQRTGFGAQAAALAANPFTGDLRIEGLVLANPAAWAERDFAALRLARIDGAAARLFGRVPRELDHVELEFSRIVLARGPEGQANWDLFMRALWPADGVRVREMHWRCDVLELVESASATAAGAAAAATMAASITSAGDRRVVWAQPLSFVVREVEGPAAVTRAWDDALQAAGAAVSLQAWLAGEPAAATTPAATGTPPADPALPDVEAEPFYRPPAPPRAP